MILDYLQSLIIRVNTPPRAFCTALVVRRATAFSGRNAPRRETADASDVLPGRRWGDAVSARVVGICGMAACWCLITGCGSGLHQVTGTLEVDGRPAMEGVQVVFTPLGDSKPAQGVVDGQGRFTLSTRQQHGVMPGSYRVILINSTASIPQPTTPIEPGVNVPPPDWIAYDRKLTAFLENPPQGNGWIPKHYGLIENSPLLYRVPEDGLEAKLGVSSDDKPAR